jgi:hypothetical protein
MTGGQQRQQGVTGLSLERYESGLTTETKTTKMNFHDRATAFGCTAPIRAVAPPLREKPTHQRPKTHGKGKDHRKADARRVNGACQLLKKQRDAH